MWTAAIVAGGQATRLGGRDKAALLVGGTPILERQLAVLHGLVPHIIIVANDPSRFSSAGVPVVPDLVPGAGSLGGVYTAVSAAPDDRTLVVAADMPFLDRSLLMRLMDLARTADLAIPHGRLGYQPLCAAYTRACVPELRMRAETGRLTLADFVRGAHGLRIVEIEAADLARFGDERVMFFNVNTPADYAAANEIAGASKPV
jgi:molybdopterin-guanine dinucleotide biosynthesis protein A